ncbi:hypothetical protein [Paenibacillus senegalimassiliensis]|uniref:hypothetical protein n=1 Tax=Paenibacillus senegalimassiliensis TaxID=1737426 RepID=UPI00073F47A9|nr:hypothetical protein [Paenibacillus senegalimassiliensis]
MDGHMTGQKSEQETGGSDKFALLIKHYRKLHNFSLKDFENGRSGSVSAGCIHQLESGERDSPSIKKLFIGKSIANPKYSFGYNLLYGLDVEKRSFSFSEVLIQNSYFLGCGMLSSKAKQSLMRNDECIDHAEWSSTSKMIKMYQLSEMIDDFKQAVR